MKKLALLSLPLIFFQYCFGQQNLAHWNANNNTNVNTNGKVLSWTSIAPNIVASAVSEALAPSIIVQDSSLKNSNSVAFGPEVSSIRYLTFPTLTVDTATIFLVGNINAISNEIHFFIAGGGQSAPYLGGLWLAGTQSNIPGFGWQGSAGAIRQSNTEPTGWGVYTFTNNRLFYNGVLVGNNNTGWPVSTGFNSLGGVPPGTNGISAAVNYFFKGKMSELFIFKGGLTNARIQTFSDSLSAEYNPVLSLGPDIDTCATLLHLQPLAYNFKSYLWSTGSTARSINITQNGTYWLQVTSFGITQRDTIIVSGLTPQPVISPSADQYLCLNRDTVTFTNVTPNQNFHFVWNNGDTTHTLKVSNASNIYLAAENLTNGCILYSDTVQLFNKTHADFGNPPICPNVGALLQNLSVDYLGDTIVSWAWNYGDPTTTNDTSSTNNGVWTYANSGSYPVYLKVTASDGCADSVVKNIVVKPTAVPNFTWQGLCYGKPTQFFDQSTPENGTQVTGYQWNFGAGINSFFINPAVTFPTGNTYPVTLKIFTSSGCNETKTLQVPVNKGVNAAFNIPDSLCAKQSVNELDQSQGVNDNITNWVWRFGSNTPVTGQNPVFAFQGTGNRVVRLTTTTLAGCVDSVQKTVFVRPTPTANFSFSVNGGNPPFIPQVNNTTVGGDEYLWTIAGSPWSDNAFTPTLPTFSDTGTYALTLTTTNTEGCSDVISKNIVVFTGDRTLQLISATCVPDGQYMGYTARVFNKGALEVNEITFGASTDYNFVLQEKWTGSLLPGQILDYPLKSSSKVFTAGEFCCVRIDKFNDTLKVQSPDNEFCLSLSNNAWVSKAYPTPSQNIVTIDFNFPFADKYTATLCEMDGKIIQSIFTNQSVSAGYGSFTTDISDVKAGMYVIRIYYRDKSYSIKVIKK